MRDGVCASGQIYLCALLCLCRGRGAHGAGALDCLCPLFVECCGQCIANAGVPVLEREGLTGPNTHTHIIVYIDIEK